MVEHIQENLFEIIFDGQDLTNSIFDRCNIKKCSFKNCIMDNVTFTKCNCIGCNFDDVNMETIIFDKTNILDDDKMNIDHNEEDDMVEE